LPPQCVTTPRSPGAKKLFENQKNFFSQTVKTGAKIDFQKRHAICVSLTPKENLAMPTKNDFPIDETITAAANRAEAVLSIYSNSKPSTEWGGWQAMLSQAIADLAILSQTEAIVAHAEAKADGESCAVGCMGIRDVCDVAADIAEATQ
jgi:hypothetical protein